MAKRLEYHFFVRHLSSMSPVFLGLVLAPVLLTSQVRAQVNGAPASVTSPGFGGRAVNGPPASVTSVGPRGYSSNAPFSFSTSVPKNHHEGNTHPRKRRYGDYIPALTYAVPVPYAVDENVVNDDADPDDDPNYQGGPTVFDRRGSGERSYVPPVSNVPKPHAEQQYSADASAQPEPVPNPTMLVFKDGRKLEVGNYAIVGATLFDLTPGHPRKVALSDLDLDATRQQNDERGVIFQLPPSAQAN